MKKIKFLLIFLISLFIFNLNVLAASGSLSVSSGSVYVGDSFTVTVNVKSSAAWNVHVTSSGPVRGCSINQADATADALDTNKTFTTTCKATGEGTIIIRLSGDVTSASNGNAVNISGSKSVTVTTKSTSSNDNSNNNNKPTTTDNRSKNNNIKELSVDGYELVKVNANNYTLSVPNYVTSINIKATAEDTKSKVTGAGNHSINIGENNILVVVTAENGSQNKINIKVTRKDSYELEDLDTVLNDDKITDINITIKSDTLIGLQDLEKVKNSKKIVKFNYYDEIKNLLYSWIIDGSKVKDSNNLLTTISFETVNKKEILKLSNYADGLFLNLKHTERLPEGAKLKIYVGNKYTDEDKVNVYYFDSNKLTLVNNDLNVKEGYIEFNVNAGSDYFVTMSRIPSTINTVSNSNSYIFIIIAIIIVIVAVCTYLFLKKKKNNKFNKYN